MGLIGQRYGLIDEEYEQVVSSADKKRAKQIVSNIVDKLIDHSSVFGAKKSGVKICFFNFVAHGIHKGKESEEWAMTVMDRTVRYLAIITKVNMDSRPKIVDTKTGKFYPISTFEDLRETFQLMRMASSMMRPYIALWYNVVFLPSFKELPDEPNKLTRKYTDSYTGQEKETLVLQETDVGITSRELAKKTYEIMKMSINAEQVREQSLFSLREMGIINMTRSVINSRDSLCSPVEGSIFSLFDDDSDARLKISDYRLYPTKNLLEQEFRTECGLAASQG